MKVAGGGSQFTFNNDASVLREYIAVSPDRYLTPVFTGRVSNQNLHGSPQVPYIIVTHASLLFEANRLAEYHRQNDGLAYVVTDVQQIYNEFSSGTPDPSAIRDFVKMFYDRAGADSLQRPKYLLLFGDGSFDYRERTDSLTNLVPVFESFNSLDPLVSYGADDFFGFLGDQDDINSGLVQNLLDIGIGRIPAANANPFPDPLGIIPKINGSSLRLAVTALMVPSPPAIITSVICSASIFSFSKE